MAQHEKNATSGWLGWVYFAGAMMAVLGIFEIIEALTALYKHAYYVVAPNSIVTFSFTTWGWIHLIIGIVVLLAGFAVLAGQMWGRVIGVLIAIISAVVNLVFLPAYPIWSILVILIDILVIYALVVHGSEAAE
jgi:hypothetical protein